MIEVLDRVMSAGKTTSLLKWLKTTDKVLFVTPLLSETEDRIKTARPDLLFTSPESECALVDGKWQNSKTEHFLKLLEAGRNVATTHSLLKLCDQRHWRQIYNKGYILVLDEELSLIEKFTEKSASDMDWLIKNNHLLRDQSNGKLTFVDSGEVDIFAYAGVKTLCDKNMLYSASRSGGFVVSCLPVDIIMCAKRVVLLTYLFKGSVLEQFLSLHGIGWKEFDEVAVPRIKPSSFKGLIEFVDERHVLPYGKSKSHSRKGINLTQSAWTKMTPENVKRVSNTIRNIFNGVDAEYCAFAVPKQFVVRQHGTRNTLVKPHRYVYKEDKNDLWLYPKCRATNEYAHKTHLVYALDVYPNQSVDAYLTDMGCNVDRDLYALSQLIQWLFRGAIRNGEKIVVGVLAPRMRDLLQRWLSDEFEQMLKRTNSVEMLQKPVDNSVDVEYDGFVGHEMPVVILEGLE